MSLQATFPDLHIGERFRLARLARRVSQEAIALLTGIPQPRISDIELGGHPTPDELRKLSDVFGVEA